MILSKDEAAVLLARIPRLDDVIDDCDGDVRETVRTQHLNSKLRYLIALAIGEDSLARYEALDDAHGEAMHLAWWDARFPKNIRDARRRAATALRKLHGGQA